MNRGQLIHLHMELCGEARKLLEKKNADYARVGDPFSNFRLYVTLGLSETVPQAILTRMVDKFSRIINFSKRGEFKVSDENIDDTIKDLINYLILLRGSFDDDKTIEELKEQLEESQKEQSMRDGEIEEEWHKEREKLDKIYKEEITEKEKERKLQEAFYGEDRICKEKEAKAKLDKQYEEARVEEELRKMKDELVGGPEARERYGKRFLEEFKKIEKSRKKFVESRRKLVTPDNIEDEYTKRERNKEELYSALEEAGKLKEELDEKEFDKLVKEKTEKIENAIGNLRDSIS